MAIGMPASLWLNEFGAHLISAFDAPAYHVGSSLGEKGTPWRDVDVRVMLDDEVWNSMGLGDPVHTHTNSKWVALCIAFSCLGHKMTGLPIDFQLQQLTHANKAYDLKNNPRSAIGIIGSMIKREA